jgi:hypothetical protein
MLYQGFIKAEIKSMDPECAAQKRGHALRMTPSKNTQDNALEERSG